MTLRQYLTWMLFSTALCWAGWTAVVVTVDPSETGRLGFALFYATLALSLLGTFAIAGLLGRALFRRREAAVRHVASSFRQGLLLSGFVTGSLALQSHGLLSWWNLLLFVATLTVLEFFLISMRSVRPRC